jgi:hypothetical protein
MSAGSTPEDYHQEYIGADRSIEIWCTEDDVEEGELVAGEETEPGGS